MAVDVSAREQAELAGATLAEWLRAKLADEIVRGAISGKLDEEGLAQRFGVSRTPVREALRQLHSMGLIRHEANKGATVAQVELSHLFEAFATVLGACVELAWERMGAAGRQQLTTAADDAAAMAILCDRLVNPTLANVLNGLEAWVRPVLCEPVRLREAVAGAHSAREAAAAVRVVVNEACRETVARLSAAG